MDIYIRNYPDCLRQVYCHYNTQETGEEYNRALNLLQKNYQFAGYRKGKVPLEIIEKQNPPELEQMVVTNMVNRVLDEVVKQGMVLYSKPKFHPFSNLSRQNSFSFHVVFETAPHLLSELDVKGMSVPYEDYAVDDKMVQYSLTHRLAALEKVTGKIQEEDVVTLNVGNPEFKAADKELTLNAAKVKALIGKKAGDSVKLSFEDLGDTVMKVLGQLNEPLEATVTTVERNSGKGITDETVQQTTPYKTLDEYKESVKKELQQLAGHYSTYNKRQALEKVIGEKVQIEFPKSIFAEAALRNIGHFIEESFSTNEVPLKELLTDKTVQEHYQEMPALSYEKIAFLITLDHIARKNNIQATPEQVQYVAGALAREKNMSLDEYKKSSSADEWRRIEKDAVREAAEVWLFDQVKFQVKGSKPLIEVK